MEQSISSLVFKGSAPEAISEAKRQKKLFVVYISGDSPDSVLLDKSTWTDPSVAESISKYCILVHISEGSIDAVQFSALYPQKSAPCITAVGYNGVQLWQNEGFVSAEVLTTSLEKIWLSLHIQETTATFLTAALASRKSEQLAYGASHTAAFERGSSSTSGASSSSTDKHVNISEGRTNADLDTEELKHCELPTEDINPNLGDEVSHASVFADKLESGNVELSSVPIDTMRETVNIEKLNSNNSGVGHMSISVEEGCSSLEENLNVAGQHLGVSVEAPLTDTMRESVNPVQLNSNDPGAGHMSFSVEEGCSSTEENLNVSDQHLGVSVEAPQVNGDEASEFEKLKNAESLHVGKADSLDIASNNLKDVHLNIRLPDGVSLQEKFSVTCTLRIVKDYVDGKQESSIGSYDLAIPYPRKVFNDQDLGKTLSELCLLNRQALIVVPHRRAIGHNKGGSFLPNQTTSTRDIGSSDGNSEGYLPFMKRILSYMNPFSYLGGAASSSSSVQESESSTWQYGPNSTPQSNLTGSRRSQPAPSNSSTANGRRDNSNSRQPTSSGFGSNIHTLKHDEDDRNFPNRNSFWNGNSTEYGGDDDGK